MALVTVQRSPSPSASVETEEQDVLDTSDSNVKSPRQRRRSKSALKKLRKLFNTVRFVTKLKPCFSESYFTVKGAALILPQSDETSAYSGAKKVSTSHAGDEIQGHLQAMCSVLRPQDIIKVAVRLEGTHTRYLAVVSCIGRQDTEESVLLGMDLMEKASVGLILPVWAHMKLKLDGDGGFSIESGSNIHIFKPVSVQAMWSALQSLNKVVATAKENTYIPRGLTHTWVGFYETKLTLEAVLVTEWNFTPDIDKSYRTDKVTTIDGEEDIYQRIRHELRNVMMTVDLEEVTCIFLRKSIEEVLGMELKEYRSFIDTEMMEILGQMDAPSKILDHLYLGSEWNASNLEELQKNGVNYILNISKEIDNFYPGVLHYMNVREWDVEKSDLLPYWEDTHKFINKARRHRSKALVHCKMGISRSGSTVIAYLMKENKWCLKEAYDFCKSKRSIVNPNPGFWKQLETYEGILNASWQREKFNQPAPTKPLSPMEEGVEIPEGISTPDSFLTVKFGEDGSHINQVPFFHAEQDIELSSRSADSTEESLPDQPSPESAQLSEKRKFKNKKSNIDKKQRSNGLLSDSEDSETNSETTDSDDLSSDDEAEDDDDNKVNIRENESKVFVPIEIPELRIDSGAAGQRRPVKVEGRRCKSEGDKNLLAADDERLTPFSREGSLSKYKPDGSWIKLEQDESEASDSNEKKIEGNISEIPEFRDKSEETEGIWMDANPENEAEQAVKVIAPRNEKLESGTLPDVHEQSVDKETKDSVDARGAADPYEKENIPWHAGLVRKQKEDIESKFGSGFSATDKKTESAEGADGQVKVSEVTKVEVIGNEIAAMKEEADSKSLTENQSESHDISSQPEDSIVNITKSETQGGEDATGSSSTSPDMKRSVYEEEEIDLPEGIVRKTTMEIEERNRMQLELDKKTLKRSSSLKSTRVTLKARDRNNERRKTCIALLSPTHPDYTERDQFFVSTSDQSADDQDQGEALASDASDDQEQEEASQTGSIKVYKFMGEEVTVEEGLVRKQTLGIENKANEPLVAHSLKSETGQTSHERCSSMPESFKISKHSNPSSEQKFRDLSNMSKESTKSIETVTDAFTDNVKDIEKGEQYDKHVWKSSCNQISVSPTSRKPVRLESRFDPETLELIREIGSALLNSPAKSQLEDDENVELKEGDSLVSHYVRKIERTSQSRQKRTRKEMIIIDKPCDENADKDNGKGSVNTSPKGSVSEQRTVTCKWSPVAKKHPAFSPPPTSIDCTDDRISDTKWSPGNSHKNSLSCGEPNCSTEVSNVCDNKTVSNVFDTKNRKMELNLDNKTRTNAENPDSNAKGGSIDKENESDVCSVKKLLDKFQQPTDQQSSGKVTPTGGYGSLSPSATTKSVSVTGAIIETALKSNNQSKPSPTCTVATIPIPDITDHAQLFQGSRSPLQQRQLSEPSTSAFVSSMSHFKQRQSEPAINLSETSLNMFAAKLNEIGSSKYKNSTVEEEGESEESDQGQRSRPKSASYSHADKERTRRRQPVRQSNTFSESGRDTQQLFSWEGKKVRKLYGKTHPLAKLPGRQAGDSTRKSPFYNTM